MIIISTYNPTRHGTGGFSIMIRCMRSEEDRMIRYIYQVLFEINLPPNLT